MGELRWEGRVVLQSNVSNRGLKSTQLVPKTYHPWEGLQVLYIVISNGRFGRFGSTYLSCPKEEGLRENRREGREGTRQVVDLCFILVNWLCT
jgi:hypothetical protein